MEDDQIIQLYWDRNQAAIPETSKKYGNYCKSIARNILGSDQDAEECVNDTYLSAWKRGGGAISYVLDELADCISDTTDIEQKIDRKELVREINLFLESLPNDGQQCIGPTKQDTETIKSISDRKGV